MKKKGLILGIVLMGMMGLGVESAEAQIVVKVRPATPKVIVTKPRKPFSNAIWIEGSWVWNKRSNRYVWQSGKWVKPRRNRTYVAGRWIKRPNGWLYVPGKWVASRRVRA